MPELKSFSCLDVFPYWGPSSYNPNPNRNNNFQESVLRGGRPRAWEGAGRHCDPDGGEGARSLPEAR